MVNTVLCFVSCVVVDLQDIKLTSNGGVVFGNKSQGVSGMYDVLTTWALG